MRDLFQRMAEKALPQDESASPAPVDLLTNGKDSGR